MFILFDLRISMFFVFIYFYKFIRYVKFGFIVNDIISIFCFFFLGCQIKGNDKSFQWFYKQEGEDEGKQQGQQLLEGNICFKFLVIQDDKDIGGFRQQEVEYVFQVDIFFWQSVGFFIGYCYFFCYFIVVIIICVIYFF